MSNYSNLHAILTNQDGSSSFNSDWFDVSRIDSGCIQIDTADVLIGNLKLQATNDENMHENDVPSSMVTFSGNTSQIWSFPFGFGYKFIRISWDYVSGIGTFEANIHTQDDE